MSWAYKDNVRRQLLLALSVVSLAVIGLWFGADQNKSSAQLRSKDFKSGKSAPSDSLTFPGTGVGPIPDGACGANDLQVQFNVTGIPGPPNKVEVRMRFDPAHTYVGDLDLEIVAPNGTRHWLQSYTGGQGGDFGDGSFAIGPYLFSDAAPSAPTWWTAASLALNDDPIPAGSYRTQAPGPFANDSPGPPITNMTAAFAGIPTSNGNWRLVVGDCAGGDVGSIAAADLILNADPQPPQVDFDGDGISDYSIVRDSTPPLTGVANAPGSRRSIQELQKEPGFKPLQASGENAAPSNHGNNLEWWINNSASSSHRNQLFGQPATDFWVPEDFDGDGVDDIAVWRSVAPSGPAGGFFYTFTSSNNTVNEIDFGQAGDNPTVVGDYDGDGTADPAVYRCPSGGGQCMFFYKGSAGGGGITYFNWGNNTSTFIRPYPGDFDGDGNNDFCIFQNGQYVLYRSSDGGVEWINWGLPTDPVIGPGDYDGDGKTDFMNVRVNGVDVEWWLLNRNGGQSLTIWGALVPGFAEFATPGDFDGDGRTDIAVWRRDNSSNTNTYFYTLRSSDGMLDAFLWGSMGDAPVPGWNSN